VDGVIFVIFRDFPGGEWRQIHSRCGLHSYTQQIIHTVCIYIRTKGCVLSPYRPIVHSLSLLREKKPLGFMCHYLESWTSWLLFSICSRLEFSLREARAERQSANLPRGQYSALNRHLICGFILNIYPSNPGKRTSTSLPTRDFIDFNNFQ